MRASRTFAALLASIALAGFVAGCDQPTQTPASPEAQAVASAKTGLAITFAGSDSAGSVTGDLTLPTTATGDVAVSWASNAPSVISVSGGTGTVTRPAVGQADASVTLTATLTKGDAKDTKAFSLTVKARALAFVVDHDWTLSDMGAGSSTSINAAIKSGSHIYAGSDRSGLVYSDDSGNSWQAKTEGAGGLSSRYIYSLALSGTSLLIGTSAGLDIMDTTTGTISNVATVASQKVTAIRTANGYVYLAASDGLYWGLIDTPSSIVKVATTFSSTRSLHIQGSTLYVVGEGSEAAPEELNVFTLDASTKEPQSRSAVDIVYDTDRDGTIEAGENNDYGLTAAGAAVFSDGSTIVIGSNSMVFSKPIAGTAFVREYSIVGGTILAFAWDGSRLLAAQYGADLSYCPILGGGWSSVEVPGHIGTGWSGGLLENDISCDGSAIVISHNGGLIIGHF